MTTVPNSRPVFSGNGSLRGWGHAGHRITLACETLLPARRNGTGKSPLRSSQRNEAEDRTVPPPTGAKARPAAPGRRPSAPTPWALADRPCAVFFLLSPVLVPRPAGRCRFSAAPVVERTSPLRAPLTVARLCPAGVSKRFPRNRAGERICALRAAAGGSLFSTVFPSRGRRRCSGRPRKECRGRRGRRMSRRCAARGPGPGR